jgi:hypothetical protein
VAEGRGVRPWVVRYHRREIIPAVAAEAEVKPAESGEGAGDTTSENLTPQ